MAAHQDRALDDLRNNLHEYARMLRRRWRLGLLGVCVVGSVAFWISQYVPRQYGAATIFERRDDVVLRNLIHANSPYSFEQLKSSIKLDMTGSRALAEAAVSIGLLPADALTSETALTNTEMRQLSQALRQYDLTARVSLVQSSPSLDTIELRCSGNNPEVARQFVIALRDNYIQRTYSRISEILTGTREFFEQEVDRFQARVTDASQRLQEQFDQFPGVDPSDPASAGTRLETLRGEHLRLTQRQAELEAQIDARERFLTSGALTAAAEPEPEAVAEAPPALPETDSAIDQAIKQVEQQLADAIVVKRMTSEHPEVLAMQRKLENLRAARDAAHTPLATARAETAKPTATEQLRKKDPVMAGQRLRVELELDSLRSQLAIANRHVDDSQVRLSEFTVLYERLLENSDDLRQLQDATQQDIATAGVWRQHLSQLERVMAAESEQRGTQFALLEEPTETTRAIRPRAISIFVVCLGCGLAAAALMIALAELFDRSFRSAAQVTRSLSLPVLECIGVLNTPKVQRRQFLTRLAWTPAMFILLVSLFGTASLAYASLERPDLHRQAVTRLDSALRAVGAPPTFLLQDSEE